MKFAMQLTRQLGTSAAVLLAALTLSACSPDEKTTAAKPTTTTASSTVNSERADDIRAATKTVNAKRVGAADSEPGNWMAHGRTNDEQRHSLLKQVNEETVGELGLAWFWDTGTNRGLEATPIVVDGIMFSTGSWSVVWAHDARTGELLWEYDPQVPRAWGKYACCDVVNRGVAVWEGKVYFGTIDGRLIALDAGTGTPDWSVQTTDPERPYTITGAPRVVDGKVIMGNGGAEYGVRGYVTAYSADEGKELWRFYTVPGDPAKPFESDAMKHAATTWRGGKWWEVGGGGTAWDAMAYDAELNLLYIGVGNGAPWNRYIRSPGGGDNLYISSIVALNPDDGSLKWHYQTTPGDTWDYTATQHMILADLEIGGEQRQVIMQAPKNGFFYVLDRATGEFLSAEAYVPVNWASHIDPETGRPVENPDAHYANDIRKIRPAPYGGHNWHPMSYHPGTGLVYIPVLDLSFKFGQDNAFQYNKEEWNTGVDFGQTIPNKDPDELIKDIKDVRGYLAAWDPIKQEERWRVQHPMSWNGGILSTAGNLVFQGRADGYFAAYTADTGKLVWEFPTNVGVMAAPVTYTVDGEQYISVLAGWGGAFGLASGLPRHRNNVLSQGRILTFKIGGEVKLPEVQVAYLDIPEPIALETTPEQVAHGESLFHKYCSVCHGGGANASTGGVPDLRYTTAATHQAWDAIVRQGAFIGKGMARFDHVLDEDDSKAIQAYVVNTAKNTIAFCETQYRKDYPEVMNSACTRASVSAGQ